MLQKHKSMICYGMAHIAMQITEFKEKKEKETD